MAGVGHLLYSVPVVLISIVVLYIVLFIGVFGTAIASTAAIAALPQDLAGFGAVVGGLGSVGVFFLILFSAVSLINLLMAPINASLLRAVAKQQRGEEQLTIGS